MNQLDVLKALKDAETEGVHVKPSSRGSIELTGDIMCSPKIKDEVEKAHRLFDNQTPDRDIEIIYDGCFTSNTKDLISSSKYKNDKVLVEEVLKVK